MSSRTLASMTSQSEDEEYHYSDIEAQEDQDDYTYEDNDDDEDEYQYSDDNASVTSDADVLPSPSARLKSRTPHDSSSSSSTVATAASPNNGGGSAAKKKRMSPGGKNGSSSSVHHHNQRRQHDEYRVIDEEELFREQRALIHEIAQVLEIAPSVAAVLLRHFGWNKEKLYEGYYADPVKAQADAGVAHATTPVPTVADGTLVRSFTIVCTQEVFYVCNPDSLTCVCVAMCARSTA